MSATLAARIYSSSRESESLRGQLRRVVDGADARLVLCRGCGRLDLHRRRGGRRGGGRMNGIADLTLLVTGNIAALLTV